MRLADKIKDPFKKSLLVSFLSHLGLVLFLYLNGHFFFNNDEVIIKNAIQVDLVALPDKAKPQAKPKVKKAAAKKPSLKKKPKFNKKDQSSALKSLKAMSAIEKLKKQQQQQAERIQKITQALAEQKLKKGNIVNKTNSLTGLDRIKMNQFYEAVRIKVNTNFFVPSFLKNQQLSTKVLLKIASTGVVLSKTISQPSGNDIFDQAVMTSIDKASPLPAPPDRLKRRLEIEGFILGFPE